MKDKSVYKMKRQDIIFNLKADLMEAVWEATDENTKEVGIEMLSFLIDDVLEDTFNL